MRSAQPSAEAGADWEQVIRAEIDFSHDARLA